MAASTGHTAFPLLAGGRNFTAVQAYDSSKTFSGDYDIPYKKWIVDQLAALGTQAEWQDSCLDELLTPPGSPATGARYLINGTGAGGWAGKDNQIAEWNGSAWEYTVPTTGTFTSVDDKSTSLFYFGGSAWVEKYFESTTASLGCKKNGMNIEADLKALGGLELVDTNSLQVKVDASSIERSGAGALQVKADGIKDSHIDFGTGTNQVSAVDLPIADSAGNFDASDVEAALAELASMGGAKKYQVGTSAVAKGDLVYMSAANKIQKMPINAQHEPLGIALEAGDPDAYVRVQAQDVIVTGVLSSATLDDKVYWTGTALSQTQPSTSGNYVHCVGIPVNSTDLAVRYSFVKKNA
jgi:hypothetical protein